MPYVVKVTAYLDQHGNPVSNLKDAKFFEKKEIAESAAFVTDGIIKEVSKVIIMPKKNKILKTKNEPIKKEKNTQGNQLWMKVSEENNG
ncbi:hypothetical protein [Enterococcus faecalis]|uniref:hypothetical protein n=1 Tax=Enterococcus faecalis TaxID=1351 RepID=UPI0022DF9485|nr:hypothetical protein [Enterococcus faecalis]